LRSLYKKVKAKSCQKPNGGFKFKLASKDNLVEGAPVDHKSVKIQHKLNTIAEQIVWKLTKEQRQWCLSFTNDKTPLTAEGRHVMTRILACLDDLGFKGNIELKVQDVLYKLQEILKTRHFANDDRHLWAVKRRQFREDFAESLDNMHGTNDLKALKLLKKDNPDPG